MPRFRETASMMTPTKSMSFTSDITYMKDILRSRVVTEYWPDEASDD